MLGKFKFKGSAQPIYHNGELLKEGATVELSAQQYADLKGNFEPVDDQGRSMAEISSQSVVLNLSNLANHEQRGVLEEHKKKFEEQLNSINRSLEAIDKAEEQPKRKRGEIAPPAPDQAKE